MLDSDTFPTNVIGFENNKLLIWSNRTKSAKEKILWLIECSFENDQAKKSSSRRVES
jgi:hypothetical protein